MTQVIEIWCDGCRACEPFPTAPWSGRAHLSGHSLTCQCVDCHKAWYPQLPPKELTKVTGKAKGRTFTVGNHTIEFLDAREVNGWITPGPKARHQRSQGFIIYGAGQIGYDFPEIVPLTVKSRLLNHSWNLKGGPK